MERDASGVGRIIGFIVPWTLTQRGVGGGVLSSGGGLQRIALVCFPKENVDVPVGQIPAQAQINFNTI